MELKGALLWSTKAFCLEELHLHAKNMQRQSLKWEKIEYVKKKSQV